MDVTTSSRHSPAPDTSSPVRNHQRAAVLVAAERDLGQDGHWLRVFLSWAEGGPDAGSAGLKKENVFFSFSKKFYLC